MASQSHWTLWEKENSLFPAKNRTSIPWPARVVSTPAEISWFYIFSTEVNSAVAFIDLIVPFF
jgi:hypothetical protein